MHSDGCQECTINPYHIKVKQNEQTQTVGCWLKFNNNLKIVEINDPIEISIILNLIVFKGSHIIPARSIIVVRAQI